MKKVFKILLIVLGILAGVAGLGAIYVKKGLPNLAEAPSLKIEPNETLLKRGAYLANHVALCLDCHSKRDWSKFSGPPSPGSLGGGGDKFGRELGLPGEIFSKNITPAALSSWTDGEIFRAMTTGVGRQGEALFPIMPYHAYGQLDESDIKSLIVYIRTLAPIENEIPERVLDFPLNFLVNTMPQEATFTKKPDPTEVLAYGQYLVTMAGCSDCHSVREQNKPFAGGAEIPMPNGTVRSANITPHNGTGIGGWTKEAFIKRFKTYSDSSYLINTIEPDAFNSFMPWIMYSGMTEEDLGAIYTYLQSLEPIEQKVERFTPKK